MNVGLCERRVITGDGAKGRQPKAENIGKERIEQHGFYGSVALACEAYLRKSPMSGEAICNAATLIAQWKEAVAASSDGCKQIPKKEVTNDHAR